MIETILVLVLVSALASVGVLMSRDTYQSVIQRAERDVVVTLLQKARSHALNNFNQSRWGVCAEPDRAMYVFFRGTYSVDAHINEYTAMASRVVASSSQAIFLCARGGVVFTQLTATTSSTTLFIVEGASTSTISIHHEGTIAW